jgi:hypothetical protein
MERSGTSKSGQIIDQKRLMLIPYGLMDAQEMADFELRIDCSTN